MNASASAGCSGAVEQSDANATAPEGGGAEQDVAQHVLSVARDPYRVLGLERYASCDDVKRAYRRLALLLHPDKNRAEGAEEAFKALNAAFDTLSCPHQRAAYDALQLRDIGVLLAPGTLGRRAQET